MQDNWPRNLLLVALFGVVTLYTAHHESFLPFITAPFWLVLIIGFAVSIWMALNITTGRLLALLLGIFILEYIKEGIGIESNMWYYHGLANSYNFGVWAWVMGGMGVFWLAVRLVCRWLRRLTAAWPRRWNLLSPVIVVLCFVVIPLTLGNYRSGAGGLFWALYLIFFLVSLITACRLELPVFLALLLTTWVVGFGSEYVGAVVNHLWTFKYNPDYPPFFLIAGCWPLEILTQYALAAFLAQEPLDKYTI